MHDRSLGHISLKSFRSLWTNKQPVSEAPVRLADRFPWLKSYVLILHPSDDQTMVDVEFASSFTDTTHLSSLYDVHFETNAIAHSFGAHIW